MRDNALVIPSPVWTRFDVFQPAVDDALRARRPLYVEFGVYEGETIFEWSRRVPSASARFIGFDSFEGLPENWANQYRQGVFSTFGKAPQTDDERISFITGWFDKTVERFVPPEHDLLIVNIDSDLYSSAIVCLEWTARYLGIGDYLYLDEFQDRLHEGRAFEEFVAKTGFCFEAIAATYGLERILFLRTG